MSTLIDMARLTVEEGGGIATFEAVEVHSANVARYLKLNDRRAYEVGNGCGTCQLWFTRLEGANGNVAVDELRDRLATGLTSAVGPAATLFEFVVPVYPPTWLDTTTVESFAARADAEGVPTAVSLSALDVKQPADWPDDQSRQHSLVPGALSARWAPQALRGSDRRRAGSAAELPRGGPGCVLAGGSRRPPRPALS